MSRNLGSESPQWRPSAHLRQLLASPTPAILSMPCAYDALSAKLVARAGFPLTFMTGFGVSAVRGFPDSGLVSYGEMDASAREICNALRPYKLPCIGDGDTGYGNELNVKRTVKGYAAAGMAGIMIEDQVAPKRCGHTKGKSVVATELALGRVQAACDARDELASQGHNDILILARTDARESLGLDEAISRCQAFREIGADITFLEAPQSVQEMRQYCEQVTGPKLANMLEEGKTPILPPAELAEIGYKIAAYPLTLLSASMRAMENALELLKQTYDDPASEAPTVDELGLLSFKQVQDIVGFNDYWIEEERYKGTEASRAQETWR